MTNLPAAAITAMCECSHHWSVHAESGRTAKSAVCHGYIGSATPGPLYEPCRCTGFRPWRGPRDARTGEPVRPLTMATDSRVAAVARHERFAQHAAPEAIQAALDQACAAQLAASRDIKWLTELLIARADQIRNGEWPAKENP